MLGGRGVGGVGGVEDAVEDGGEHLDGGRGVSWFDWTRGEGGGGPRRRGERGEAYECS